VVSEVGYRRWIDSLELSPGLLGRVDGEGNVELVGVASCEVAVDHLSLELDPCLVEKRTEADGDDGGNVTNLDARTVVNADGVAARVGSESAAGMEFEGLTYHRGLWAHA
jgi:hypothetical protein